MHFVGRNLQVMPIVVLQIMLGSTAVATQICDTRQFPMSTPTSAFQDKEDGTVIDKRSRLQWMRCSAGQTWRDGKCWGNAKGMTWSDALEYSKQVNQSGYFFYNDWRLPNIRDLALITERQCENPRINAEVFPGTVAGPYWTNTHRASEGFAPTVFTMSFGHQGIGFSEQESVHFVRLVRQAD